MMKHAKPLVLIVCVFLSVVACVKQEDFDMTDLSVSQWQPDVAVPLVNSSVAFKDVSGLVDSGQLIVDPNGRVTIINTSSIYERSGKSFFSIPDQQAAFSYYLDASHASTLNSSGSCSESVSQSVLFLLPSGQRIDRVTLSTGVLFFSVSNTISRTCTLNISIPSLQLNGSGFSAQAIVPPSTSNRIFSYVLNGYTADLTAGGQGNRIDVNFSVTFRGSGANVSSGTALAVSTNLNNLDYSYVEGYVGPIDFRIPLDTVALDLYSNDPTDIYQFSDPRLSIEIENSVGIPSRLDSCFVQPIRDDGSFINASLLSPLTTYAIDYPTIAGDARSTVVSINSQNSSIVSSYAARPSDVIYTALAHLNPGAVPVTNFITDSSKIQVNLRSELPLDGFARRLTIRDTSTFELEELGELDSVVFRLEARNGFPLTALTQVLFLSNGLQVDSLFHTSDLLFIEAADVDASGFSIGSKVHIHDEPIGQERL
ncbi:MAG: hypothetical protein ACKO1U_01755, partial [Bacteroidota bacterium]